MLQCAIQVTPGLFEMAEGGVQVGVSREGVRIAAEELALRDRIQLIQTLTSPVIHGNRKRPVDIDNQ
jgi:hypothetical protein